MDVGTFSAMLIFLIVLALAFDFMNGFHDAANSIATIVSTGVLTPLQAVLWAAMFNVLAFWFFELEVAATVGKGIIESGLVDNLVIFGAPVGAIAWNLITCYYGIPSSSSHARIGVLLGATLMVAVSWICLRQTPRRVDKWFTRTQLVSSALYSLGHGSNDAQKTMGIIWLPLISPGGTTKDHLPM